MFKKIFLVAIIAIFFCNSLTFYAFAEGWEKDQNGWYWMESDGTFFSNGWRWLDGNQDGIAECYYFKPDGYCLLETITPDGYTVNADGAWIVAGAVQTKAVIERKNFTREQAIDIVIANVDEIGWWDIVDDSDNPLIMWQFWRTGSKGKYMINMETGDCYVEAPYSGVDIPYSDIPLTQRYVLNINDYL